MRRTLAGLMAILAMSTAAPAFAAPEPDQRNDPLGDLIAGVLTGTLPGSSTPAPRASGRWTAWAARSWPCAPWRSTRP
jgi:hypothetical protein